MILWQHFDRIPITNTFQRLTFNDSAIELVQLVLQGIDEPAHGQQPDDEHGQNEEHAHCARWYLTSFKRRFAGELVPIAEPGKHRVDTRT